MALSEDRAGQRDGGTDDKVHVMVVDDSAVIRGLLTRTLEADPKIRVVASVGNGQVAINTLQRMDVEVVILDIEMPVMDGMTALPKLIAARPGLQVIMASTLTHRNAAVSLKALEQGAAHYVTKPGSTGGLMSATDFQRELTETVKTLGLAARKAAAKAGRAPVKRLGTATLLPAAKRPEAPKAIRLREGPISPPQVLAIGSSTGGPQALFAVLARMADAIKVPVLITQHMPATFTTILAEHIGQTSGMPSAEGRDGEPVIGGRIYVAPGDFHMKVVAEGTSKIIRLTKEPPENFCRPAVDPMLRSVAAVYGRNALAVILTGMGQDGMRGAQALTAAGGSVIAQDEATSVVWGMPGAAAMAGVCSAVLPLQDISPFIRRLVLRTAA
jgi:two-component system chemotaxis response regulator CheB